MSLIQKDSEGNSYEILTLPEWEEKQEKPIQDLEGLGGFLNYATGALAKAGQDPEETYGKVQQNLFRVAVDRGLIEAPAQEDPEAPAKLQKAFEGFSNRVSEDSLRDYSLVANSIKDIDPDAASTFQTYYDRNAEARRTNQLAILDPEEESKLEEFKSKYFTLDQIRDARIQTAKENGLAYVDYRADDKGQRGVWINPDPAVAKDKASIIDSFERSNNLISAATLKFAQQQVELNPGRDTARWEDTQNAELKQIIQDSGDRINSKNPESAAFAQQIQGALKTAQEFQKEAYQQGVPAEEALKKEVTEVIVPKQFMPSSFAGMATQTFQDQGTGKVAEAEISKVYDNLKAAYPDNALFSQYTRDQFVKAAGDLVKQGLEVPVNNEDPTKNFVKLSDGTYTPLSSTALLPKASFESAMDKLGLDDRAKAAAEVTRKGYLANNADAIEEALEEFDGDRFTNFSIQWLDKQDPLARTSKADLIEDYMSEASKRTDWNVFSAKATGIGMSVVKSFNPIIQAIGGGVSNLAGFEAGKQVFLDWAIADATTEANRKKYTNLYGSDLGLGYEFLAQAAPMVADIALTGGASSLAKGAVKGLTKQVVVEGAEQAAKTGIKGLLAKEISIPVGGLVPSSVQEFAGNVTKNWIAKSLSPETRKLFGQSYVRKFADVGTEAVKADSALVAKVFQGVKADLANTLPQVVGVATQRATSFARSAQGQYVSTTINMRSELNPDGSRKFTDEQIHKAALTNSLVSGSITALVEHGFGKVFGEGADAITYGKANLQQLKFYTNRVSGALQRSSLGGEEVFNALKTVTRQILKDSGYQTLRQGVGEFGEEFTDQLAQSVAIAMLDNKELDVVGALKDSFHAGLLGFGYGAGVHGATTSGIFSKQNIRRDYEQGIAQSVEGRVLSGVISKLEADGQSPETVAALKTRMQLAARRNQPVSERIPVRPASADVITALDGLDEQPLNIGQRPNLQGPTGSTPTRKASQIAAELNVSAQELLTIQGSGKAVQGAGSTITPNDVEAYVARRAANLANASDIDWNDQAAVEAYVTRNGAQFISEGAGEVPSVEETRTFKDLAGRLVVVDGVRGRVRIEEDGVLLDPETGEAPFIVTPNPDMLATEFEGFEGAVAEPSEVSPKRGVRKVKLSISETGQIVYGKTKYDAPTKPTLANVKLAADGSIDSMFVLVQNQNGKPTYAYVTGENAQRLQKIYEDRGPESAQDFKDAVSNSQTQDIQRNQAAANSKQKRSSKRRQQKRTKNNGPLVTNRGQQVVEQEANYALARINAGAVNEELISELRAVAVQLGLDPDSFTSVSEMFVVVGPELAAGLDLDNFTAPQIQQAVKNVQQGNISTLLDYLVQQESMPLSERAVQAQWFAKLRTSHRNQFTKHGIKSGPMDVKTVLQSIARSASNKLHRKTAQFLLSVNADLCPVSVYSSPNDLGRSGMYLPTSNLIVLNSASDNGGGIVDVLLHELMHFGTENLISNPKNAFEQDLRGRLLALRSEIQIKAEAKFGDAMPETLRYAVEGRMSKDEDFSEEVAIREFIVHYYASQKFREQLSDLNAKGERGFVQRFLDIIASWFSGKRVPDPGSKELVETMLDLQKAVANGSGLPGQSLGSVLASRAESARNAGHGTLFGVPNTFERKTMDWVGHQTDSMQDGIFSEDQLRELIVNGKFAFLTAENPSKTDAGEEANAEFNARAEQWLISRGYNNIDRVVGRYVNGENSFLIEGFTDQDAVDFAAEFQQESVATDSGLHYPDGSFEARGGENLDSFYDVKSDDNFFTNVRTKDGKLITVRVSYPGRKKDSGLRPSQESTPAAISENPITRQIQNQKEFAVVISKETTRPFALEGNTILVNEELANQVFGDYNLEEQASLVERELAVAVAYELAIQKVGFDTYVAFENAGLNTLQVIDRAAKNDLTQADLQDMLALGKTAKDLVATAFEEIGLRNDGTNERLAVAQNRLGDLFRYLERGGEDIDGQAKPFADSISVEDLAIVERLKPVSEIAFYSRAYAGIKPEDIKPGQALGSRNPTGKTATERGVDPQSLISLDVLARDPKAYRTNALYLTEYPIVAREFPKLAAKVRGLRKKHLKTAVLIRTNADEIKRFKKSLKGLLAVDKRAVTDKVFEDALLEENGGLEGEAGRTFATQQAALEKRLLKSEQLKIQSKKEKSDITKTLAGFASDPNHEIAKLAPQIYQTVIENTRSNLMALINLFPENIRPIAKWWYDGANKIANEFGSSYAQDVEQAAGVLAVFSPQKDWFMNISLAERTMKIWHELFTLDNPNNIVWSSEMSAQWLKRAGEPQITTEGQDGKNPIYEKGKVKAVYDEDGNHAEDEQGNPIFEGWSSSSAEANRTKARDILKNVQGKALKDLSPEDQARFIRMYSEVNDSPVFMKYAPDGTNTGVASRSETSGKEIKIAWGAYSTIQKAIRIMSSDKSNKLEVVSSELGNQHKVRSFYNNIVDPNNQDGHVTMDTHAVAALYWQAFSGNSFEVSQNFGSSNVTNNSILGVNGLYAVNAEAYREAAKAFNLLPREIQSITWEAVRLLFPAKWKSNKKNVDSVRAVWARYETDKSFTIEDARAEIFQLATGKDINEALANTEDLAKSLGFPSWTQVELRAAQPGEVPLKQIRESRAATPQMDADYLAAVEAGDVKAQQQMVDEAAKAAGYTEEGHRAGVYRSGVPLLPNTTGGLGSGYYAILGGRLEDVSSFAADVDKGLKNDPQIETRQERVMLDLGDKPLRVLNLSDVSEWVNRQGLRPVYLAWLDYQETVNSAYNKVGSQRPDSLEARRGSNLVRRTPADKKAYKDALLSQGWSKEQLIPLELDIETIETGDVGKVVSFLFDKGHLTSVVIDWEKASSVGRKAGDGRMFMEVAVANPNQIKSADPVTYDKNGNVIPLSQRFNQATSDIRFSRATVAQQLAPTTDQEQKAFAGATKNKRSGELAVAAVRLEQGQIDNATFADLVEILDPWVVKGADQVPTVDKIKQYIVSRRDGKILSEQELEKLDKVKADLDIPEGQLVDWRIDIPTYNRSLEAGDVVYAITGHKPGGTARAAEVIGYTPIARVRDGKVVTRVEKGGPMTIAQGGGKFPLATVQGKNVKIDRLPADINDPAVWSEIAYNPARSSEFVDVRTKFPVLTFDDAIMVGSRVFMKNPVYDSKPQYQQPRVDLSGALTGETDVRFSRTSVQTDKDYIAAVGSGDIFTAQSMVNSAAVNAGYSEQTYYRGQRKFLDRLVKPTRTQKPSAVSEFINKFFPSKASRGVAWLTDSKYLANQYAVMGDYKLSAMPSALAQRPDLITEGQYGLYAGGGVLQSAKLDLRNSLQVDANGSMWNEIQFEGQKLTSDQIADIAKAKGFDSVVISNVKDGFTGMAMNETATVVAVFEDTKIKSADAVTYDNNGKAVPISQRFDQAVPNIRYSRSAAPAIFRGRDVQLTHWSFNASLKQTDPKMHGTGGIGVEKSRQQGYKEIYQPRTYFGYSSYTREQVVGPHRYQIKVSGDSLYDYESDPLSLYPTREDRKAAGYAQFDDVAARTMYEKAIKDAGYAGYVSKSYSAGVLFGKHKVTKVADSDRSLTLNPKPIKPKVMLSRAVRAVTSPDIESAYRVSLDDLMVNEVTGEFDFGNKFTRLFRASGNLDPRMFEAKQYQERAMALANQRLVGLKDSFMNALKSEPNTDLDDVNDALGTTAPTVSAAARNAAALKRDQAIADARTQYEETDKAYANYKKATTQARADYLVHQSTGRYQREVSQLQDQLASSIEKQTRDAAFVAARAEYDRDIQAARAKGAKAALATQQQALLRLEQNSPKVAFAVSDFRYAIDSVSQQLVESFGPTDPMRAVITDNLGVYLTRSYAIHHDEGYADKIKKDPAFAQTRKEARDYFERAWINNTYKDWRSNDLYAIYSDQEVRSLVEAEAKAKSIGSIELDSFIEMHGETPEVPGRVLNKTDLARFMEKGEVPRELRAILGEMQNPIENALRTYSNVTNFLGTQRLLNDFTRIGTSNGWLITAQDKAQNPEKYRTYQPLENSTKTSGGDPLSNFYAPPEIKEAFKLTFSPERKAKQSDALELLKKLDGTLAFAIGSSLAVLTLGSAGFYVRNLTSNVLYMAGNGFIASPSNIADSLQGLNEIYGTNFWNRALQNMPQGLRPDEKVNFSELGPLGADLIALGLKDSLSAGVLRDIVGGLSGADPSGFVATLEQVIRNQGKVAATAVDVTKKVGGIIPGAFRSLANVAESLDLLYKFAYYSHMVQVYTEANAYETTKWTDAQIRQMAARTVRRTTQGRSEQPAIAKAFAKSQLGTLFNSFIRFSVETVRLPIAIYTLSSEERSSGNPVLIRRGRQRLTGLSVVLASSAVSSLVKALGGFDDDEEQAIRNALPPWAKNVNYYFTRDSKDPTKIKAWNLTYVHPFSMITDPIIRATHLVVNGRADEAPEVLLEALVGAYASPQIAVDALAQLRTNTDARGGKIWYENDSTATAVGKGFKFLLNSAYRSRTATKFYEAFEAYTNDSVYDEDARLATAAELVAGEFSPFQTKKYDLVKLSRQAFSKIKRDQDEVSVERGKLKTAKPLSSQEVEEIYSDLEAARIFAAKKLAKTVAGFEKLGVSKQELARQANDVGISRDRFSQVVNRGVVDRIVFPKELLQELKEIGGEANGAARVQFLKNSINSRPSKIQLNND